jgi:DNA-binding transcriptional MerR regulator
VRLVTAREVRALTGLSPDRVREWAGRRGLIRPDMPARGKGSHARYSWQTVLALRLAAVLKDQFRVELQANRELLGNMQSQLAGRSFPALRGCVMALYGGATVELLAPGEHTKDLNAAVLLLPLEPHLEVLSNGFGVPNTMQQRPLFPALSV